MSRPASRAICAMACRRPGNLATMATWRAPGPGRSEGVTFRSCGLGAAGGTAAGRAGTLGALTDNGGDVLEDASTHDFERAGLTDGVGAERALEGFRPVDHVGVDADENVADEDPGGRCRGAAVNANDEEASLLRRLKADRGRELDGLAANAEVAALEAATGEQGGDDRLDGRDGQRDAAVTEGLVLAERLRDALPGREVVAHCGGGGMKAQFKRADRSGARYALVIGDAEVEGGTVALKSLRADEEQILVARDAIVDVLLARLAV